MKHHAACCLCQYYTRNLCAAKFETTGWRLHAFGLGQKTLQTCSAKHFLLLKNQFFENFFRSLFIHMLLKSLLLKLLPPPSANKNNFCNYTHMMLFFHRSFSCQSMLSIFPIAAPFPVLSILTTLREKCQRKPMFPLSRFFRTRANKFWHYGSHSFRKVDKFVEI